MEGARADAVAPTGSNAPRPAEDSRLGDDVNDDSPHRNQSDPLPSRPSSYPERQSQGHHFENTPRSTTGLISPRQRELSASHDSDHVASNRTSMSHWDPEPGFAHVDGEINGSGYNETFVDIVTVPCPGADPVETWTRDPLPDGFFGNPNDDDTTKYPTVKELAGDAILTPGIGGNFPKAAHLWVRQGIRRYANTARVLLYRHRELTDHTTLEGLARDLLDSVLQKREGQHVSRPVFFIAHSIGGLVVKQALLIARHETKYRGILFNCHGVTFFATPHRGSSYMSMKHLSESIQLLLHLQRPLPMTLAHNLRVGNKSLLKMHDDFTDIASEMRLWSFYETIDSELSGSGFGISNEVQFSAPIVSIKSAIVGVRQEMIYSSLQSDHAHCASFGITNPRTMSTYLHDLAAAVAKAVSLSQTIHTPLWLKDEVRIELIGFYDDPDAGLESDIRLYYTKHHLSEFLEQGPERCLEERLKCAPRRYGAPAHRSGAQAMAGTSMSGGSGGLNILTNVQRILSAAVSGSSEHERPSSPDIIVTLPSARPTEEHELPELTGRRPHSLTLPTLSTPGFQRPSSRGSGVTTSTMSDPTDREVSPKEGSHRQSGSHDYRARADSDKAGLHAASRRRAERLSRASALQDLTAGFSRPNPSSRKFMWIHLPFTNPLWVKDIFDKIAETQNQNLSKLFNHENWVSRHVHGRHSQSQPSFVKPAVHFISPDSAPSPRPSHSSPNLGNPNNPTTCLYLYLPYLHFDTYRHIVKRRNVMTRRLAHGRSRPVPEDIANLESLELRMIWEYLGYDPPLNCRRTLDQFGYPSMRDTYARDDDQMLYKLTKEDKPSRFNSALTIREEDSIKSLAERYSAGTKLLHEVVEREKEIATSDSENEAESELRDGNLLMVDQLWLWAIDTTTLTTFFPKRESRPSEGALFQQADLRNSIYNELNGDLTGRCENALDLAAFAALHAVTVLLERSSHPDLEVFRIFEEAIGMLTERMTWNLKKFRMQTFRDVGAVVDSEDEDPEDNSASSIKKRHRREIERAERENRENTSALLELRDMEDELKTLYKLFETQTAVLGKMLDIYQSDSLKDVTHNGQGYLQEALGRLDEYKSQTTEMLDRVAATRGDYEKLLEMAQRQAQVDDVRWSRLQTELASSQNLSVMIFTIFTVIFLPLSFFTSLFGMNTAEWADDKVPTLGFIGEISLPISVFMILATLVAAFSSHVQVSFGAVWRRAARAWGAAAEGLRSLEPEARRRAKERQRADRAREERADRERRRKDRSYDFWAAVRRQRTVESYKIPDLNTKRTGTGLDSAGGGDGGGGSGRATKRSTWMFGPTR